MTAESPVTPAEVLVVNADKPALGTALLIACPLYIVGIGVWRTIGHGAARGRGRRSAADDRLNGWASATSPTFPGSSSGTINDAAAAGAPVPPWCASTAGRWRRAMFAAADPGTRETDLLDPIAMIDRVQAICLSGGSAYGLSAAHGVMRWHEEHHAGFPVGPQPEHVVPIVPAAVIFDLGRGGVFANRPDDTFGYRACCRGARRERSRWEPSAPALVRWHAGCKVASAQRARRCPTASSSGRWRW